MLRLHDRVVLAVSGGRDSMVLLECAAATVPERVAAVATFDHGTGSAATAAAELVERRARDLALPVSRGSGEAGRHGEAAWREARWRFLREVAGRTDAAVATAHTRDDQVETVLMRVLRGAGARGLAGLYAPSDVVRPLLAVRREEVAACALAMGVAWMEDPTNASRAFLRNRVRLDLLPALERAAPGFGEELLTIARRAARWRAEVDAFAERWVPARVDGGALTVAGAALRRYDARQLAVLWPALAARVGVTLDRRGTRRLSAFTIHGMPGQRIQLAGGHEVVLHRDQLHLYRARGGSGIPAAVAWDALPLDGTTVLGPWRFRRMERRAPEGPWLVALPVDRPLSVRTWRPGDRMQPAGSPRERRVKGLLRDAGIPGPERRGWPVVLAGEEIVWVPGVRRSSAAPDRSGRPAMVYACERLDSRSG